MTSPASRTGRIFTTFAVIEAITWAGLLVGMYLKHVTATTEAGVWLFGRMHGAAFVCYVVVALVAARRLRWSWRTTFVALLASIPPLGTLAFEVGARRRDLLRPRPSTVPADARPAASAPAAR